MPATPKFSEIKPLAPRLSSLSFEPSEGRITTFECYDVPFRVNDDPQFSVLQGNVLTLRALGVESPDIASILEVTPQEVKRTNDQLYGLLVGVPNEHGGFGRAVHQAVRYNILEMLSGPKLPTPPLVLSEIAAIRVAAQGKTLVFARQEAAKIDPSSDFAQRGTSQGIMAGFNVRYGVPGRRPVSLPLFGHAVGALTQVSFSENDPYL
ncbi:MAG TPA: hypothetical protein VF733_05280 [Candidatus Saccharimonadales bacterium]